MIKLFQLLLITLLLFCSVIIPSFIEIDEVIDDRLPFEYNYVPNYKPQN
jgi:hypothetical protein